MESKKFYIEFNKNPLKVITDDTAKAEYRSQEGSFEIFVGMTKSLQAYFEFTGDLDICPEGQEFFRHNDNVDLYIRRREENELGTDPD